MIEVISETVKSKSLALEKKSIKPLISHSEVLQDFVTTILKEGQEDEDIKSLMEHFSNFRKGLRCFLTSENKFLQN